MLVTVLRRPPSRSDTSLDERACRTPASSSHRDRRRHRRRGSRRHVWFGRHAGRSQITWPGMGSRGIGRGPSTCSRCSRSTRASVRRRGRFVADRPLRPKSTPRQTDLVLRVFRLVRGSGARVEVRPARTLRARASTARPRQARRGDRRRRGLGQHDLPHAGAATWRTDRTSLRPVLPDRVSRRYLSSATARSTGSRTCRRRPGSRSGSRSAATSSAARPFRA